MFKYNRGVIAIVGFTQMVLWWSVEGIQDDHLEERLKFHRMIIENLIKENPDDKNLLEFRRYYDELQANLNLIEQDIVDRYDNEQIYAYHRAYQMYSGVISYNDLPEIHEPYFTIVDFRRSRNGPPGALDYEIKRRYYTWVMNEHNLKSFIVENPALGVGLGNFIREIEMGRYRSHLTEEHLDFYSQFLFIEFGHEELERIWMHPNASVTRELMDFHEGIRSLLEGLIDFPERWIGILTRNPEASETRRKYYMIKLGKMVNERGLSDQDTYFRRSMDRILETLEVPELSANNEARLSRGFERWVNVVLPGDEKDIENVEAIINLISAFQNEAIP